MADKKQLTRLKRGVKGWNEWREKNPFVRIDLSEANLGEANLGEANLWGADLWGAHLTGAHLTEANFSGANLWGAHLTGAYLSGANLTKADLTRADLSGAHLNGAHLNGAHLVEAHLTGAHLNEANLTGAHLERADLERADLSGANLARANLTEADLGGAHLSWAGLRSADLTDANLTDADLAEASFGYTTLGDVDLSNTKGLESVRHLFPSTMGIDTIYESKGNIPEVFLRGCGVPENFIIFMHSLTGKAFEFYSCFISYSTKQDDKAFAERLHADLQDTGIRCWFAPEDLKIGDKFQLRIEEAIRFYDKLLIILSTNSIESAWVEHEVRTALKKEEEKQRTVLFPIRLDDAVMQTTQQWAYEIRCQRHIGDFRQWKDHDCYQKAFERLLKDLNAKDEREGEGGRRREEG